jgi:predicted NBD/HSP70 family sugar kinase
MMDGRIYYGPGGMAGELGHIIVNADGDQCNLGHRGCLESFIGGKAVERKYGESLADICQKARDKQSVAIKITDEISKYLNQALETYIEIFNSQKIVIGGAASRSLSLFLNNKTDPRVIASSLGSDAGFFGAALLAMENR